MFKQQNLSSLMAIAALTLTLGTVGCVYEPGDESNIASRSTAVNFQGYYPQDKGQGNPNLTYHLYALNDNHVYQQIPGAGAPTSGNGTNYGRYTWYGVPFGNVVIPSWAWIWQGDISKYHAQIRMVDSDAGFPLIAFSDAERSCVVNKLGDGAEILAASSACGGDITIDVYTSNP